MALRPIARRWAQDAKAKWQDLGPTGWRSASLVERNIRHLYGEIGWVAILAGVLTFNAPFALRLGATDAQIGLLSALPALVAILVTIPAGWILAASRQRMVGLLTWTLFVNRLGYLLLALVPVLPFTQHASLAVGILVLFTAPGHFYNVGWNALLADLTTDERRAQVMAVRSILWSLVSTASIFAAGRWLAAVRFPANYQVLYLVGFGTSMISLYHVSRVRLCQPCPEERFVTGPGVRRGMGEMVRQARGTPQFSRLVVNTLAYNAGLWFVGPVYVLLYVRSLGAEEGWLGLNGTVATLAPVLGFYVWQRVIARRGESAVLRWLVMLLGLYPLLVGLTHNLSLIVLWSALYGLVAPGVSLSQFNLLVKVMPADQRAAFMAVYITATNMAAFVLPLIGALLAQRVGPAPTLVLGGALSIIGASRFLLRPVQVAAGPSMEAGGSSSPGSEA